jgi:D-3-phosphoglycerate dehydrogenase
MFKILLTEALDETAERQLAASAQVVRPPSSDEETLRRLVIDCDALVVRTHHRVTRAVLAAGHTLRVVGVAGVGVDNVDVRAANELGIAVLSTPAAATEAVADLAVALMLQLLRPIPQLAEQYRQGQFHASRAQAHGRELCELTVGIVGMGRIGSRVGRICAAGFGARVLYNDIIEVGPFDFPARSVDKPTIWAESDIVTLHVPLTEQTCGLVNTDVLARLRPTALLINTARGGVVNTTALLAALDAGRVAGAALDVVEPEPLPAEHPLFACKRCIVTPHIAARTHGGMRRMCAVVDQVLAFLHDHP